MSSLSTFVTLDTGTSSKYSSRASWRLSSACFFVSPKLETPVFIHQATYVLSSFQTTDLRAIFFMPSRYVYVLGKSNGMCCEWIGDRM